MSSTVVSPFSDVSNNLFGNFGSMMQEPFSPTSPFPLLNFDKRILGSTMTVDDLKGPGGQNTLMRSMSCNVTSKVTMGNDFVISGNNNILDNSKDTKPRDRAFSESDRNQRNAQNSNRYKTELCRPFMENGKCKYGDKCQFAHGEHEIRNLQRHPKYKTELCRTYHTVGICPYGPRCHFIHNPVERKHYSNTSPKQRRERTVERPTLLTVANLPRGSTGELTPPPSESPVPFSQFGLPDGTDHLLESLKAQARELATGEQSEFIIAPRGMSPTLPSPITSAPGSPFPSGHDYSNIEMQLRDNVFFSNGLDSKPASPNSYRPPSPPDSDPESYCGRTSPTGPVGRSSRLPIFRGMSMEEYR